MGMMVLKIWGIEHVRVMWIRMGDDLIVGLLNWVGWKMNLRLGLLMGLGRRIQRRWVVRWWVRKWWGWRIGVVDRWRIEVIDWWRW